MSYQVVNLVIQQGADFIRQLQFTGIPEGNLDDYQLRGKIRTSYTATQSLIDFTVTKELGSTTATVSLTAAQTAELPSNCFSYQISSDFQTRAINRLPDGYYVYDVELVAPGGRVFRVLEGGLVVVPEVTK